MMNTMRNKAARAGALSLLFALAALAAVSLAPSSARAESDYTWVDSQPLKWASNGLTTRSFTASSGDTDSVILPSDWAEEVGFLSTAAAWPIATLKFTVSASAANADTVKYLLLPCGMGICAQGDPAAATLGVGTIALKAGPVQASGGRLFMGVLNRDPTANATNTHWKMCGAASGGRLKVCGDPDGALTNLKVVVHYPRRVR